jgi:YfiH family protein
MMQNDYYISFPLFDQFEELICAFSTRRGGYSKGSFSSLNMGNIKSDDPLLVMKNRNLFYNKLGILKQSVALPDQIHSANVKIISKSGMIPQTDALISNDRGLFLGIQTADCFPVFIYSPKKKTIGIVHAGWKGVVQDILMKTIDTMIENLGVFPSDLFIAVGPGLQKECFEVRSDVYKYFPEEYLEYHKDTSKRYLKLAGYLYNILISMNVPAKQIYISDDCTKCNHKQFFSYRRDGEKSGRMMGIIGIRHKNCR